MSSSKGGAAKSKNYYGTVAGAVCWGPLDYLTAVIHNGGYLWQGSLTLTADVTDLTGSIADPSLIGAGGYLKLYRGTATQTADPALVGHSPYKDTVLLVGKNLFFGQDSGTAPNLQIIGGRLPRVPTSIVASADNVMDDGQINPIAALAEFLLDERGAGVPQASFDASSWLSAAHWAFLNKDFAFCSPLITEQMSVSEVARRLLEPISGFIRWSPAGKLTCKIYEWGVDPGGLVTIDAQTWVRKPKFVFGDWTEIPTEYLVSFTDRAFDYQENSVLVPNARAAQIRQVDDQRRLDRPDITRAGQANRHAVEVARRLGTAPSTVSGKLRGPIIASILPGDKVRVDVDPEPGGAGLSQLCRVLSIKRDRSDEATVKLQTDNLLPATVYQPSYTIPTTPTEVALPLQNYIGVPLPPNAFGWPPAVGLLASRPAQNIVGFEAFFGPSHAGAFSSLGQQPGFAVRATLSSNISNAATVARFSETDGLSAPDAGLAADTPGGNTTEAGDNALLALLVSLDVNGRIALGADGNPVMEFVSIVDRAFVSGAAFDYTILRGRLGTTAQAWTAGTLVWIVPRANIVPWRHSLLSSMLGGVAYFRLVSFTMTTEDVTTPVPELSVNMLPATAPMFGGNIDGNTGPDDGVAPNPVTSVVVTPGLGVLVLNWTNPTNTPLRNIFIYESATTSKPNAPSFSVDPAQNFFFRTGLAASTQRYYWIEVQAQNGRRTSAGPYNNTTRAGVDLSDLVPGMETVGIVSALPTPAGYTGPKNVLLTSDLKLYRYDAGGPGWTRAVDGGDIVANSIVAGAIAAGAITATAVGSNLIITNTANVGTAVINSAAIIDLLADKVTAGNLVSMILRAGSLATDFKMHNPAYGTGSQFPSVAMQNGTHTGPNTSLSSTEFWFIAYYGWATGSGYASDRFGKSDVNFVCFEQGGASPTSPNGFVDLEIVCRINGGSSFTVTAQGTRATAGNGTLNASGSVALSGLNSTDVVEFGVRCTGNFAGDQLNVANLSVIALNF
jgi:hypothetical protein